MNRCKDVLANNTLVEHDGVLIVVSLPWHISHEEVAAKSQLSILGSISLGKDVTSLNSLSLVTNRTEVDGHILVGATELRNTIFLQCWFETYEFLILCAIVEDTYSSSVNIFNNTITLGSNHSTRVLAHLLLDTGTNDRSLIVKQWHCLSHHVRSHECTVGIVMLEERNQ